MKRLGTLLLALSLLCALTIPALSAAAENPFSKSQDYAPYPDVTAANWYYPYAKLCQEVGIITGKAGGFDGQATITQAETLTIAARLHQTYYGNPPIPADEYDWFQPIWEYATAHDLIYLEQWSVAEMSTRGQFLTQMSKVFPPEMFPPLNQITAIPDLTPGSQLEANALYFYNAGILTGLNPYGSFSPQGHITRAEVAAIVARIIDPALRVSFSPAAYEPDAWKKPLTKLLIDAAPKYISDFDGLHLSGYDENNHFYYYKLEGDRAKAFLVLDSDYNLNHPTLQDGMISEARFLDNTQGSFFWHSAQYYDTEGRALFPSATLYRNGTNFEDGIALVTRCADNVMCVIDKTGAVIRELGPTVAYDTLLSDGMVLTNGVAPNNDTTVLDLRAEVQPTYSYSIIERFSAGLAPFYAYREQGLLWGYINRSGTMVIPMAYDHAGRFHNGFAVVSNYGDNWQTSALIDKSGNEVIPMAPGQLGEVNSSGLLYAYREVDGAFCHRILNTKGEIVTRLPSDGTYYYTLMDSYIYQVKPDGYSTILSLSGEDLLPGTALEYYKFTLGPTACLIQAEDGIYLYQ